MLDQRTSARGREEGRALRRSVAALAREARALPEGSMTRLTITGAAYELDDALDDLTGGQRIGLDRARALAEEAVRAGLASWGDGPDDVFRPTPALRRRLDEVGVPHVLALAADEADGLAQFIAARHS